MIVPYWTILEQLSQVQIKAETRGNAYLTWNFLCFILLIWFKGDFIYVYCVCVCVYCKVLLLHFILHLLLFTARTGYLLITLPSSKKIIWRTGSRRRQKFCIFVMFCCCVSFFIHRPLVTTQVNTHNVDENNDWISSGQYCLQNLFFAGINKTQAKFFIE